VFYGLCHQQQSRAPAGFFSTGNSGMQKKLTTFLVLTLKTQVFSVTTNAQNTLPHFQGASSLKTFSFFSKMAVVFVEGGRLCHGTMAQWPVQARPSLIPRFYRTVPYVTARSKWTLTRVLKYLYCQHLYYIRRSGRVRAQWTGVLADCAL